MVTFNDVLHWLGEYSDELTSVLAILAIFLAYYTARNAPKWEYEAEYKLSIIKDVFPRLLSNIRNTLDFYNELLDGKKNNFDAFPYLIGIIESGKIQYIKIMDKSLYDGLQSIVNNIMPILNTMIDERHNLYSTLNQKWKAYLDNFPELNPYIDKFLMELWSYSGHYIWIEDYDEVRKIANQKVDEIFKINQQAKPPSKDNINQLIKIAQDEISNIKRNVEEINNKIEQIITDNVIISLEKHISNPI